MEDIVVIIITFNWDARFEQATVLQFQFRQFWNIQNCPLSLTYTCNLHFVCNIPFLKICCEKEIAQWSINDSSIQNHSTMKCGSSLRKGISTNLDEFCKKFQPIWLLLHSLCSFCGSGPSWFNFLSKAHVPSRLWVNAYIREVCGWKFDQMDDPSIQISTSLICIYSQATRNVNFRQEIKSKLSFPFNSSCI